MCSVHLEYSQVFFSFALEVLDNFPTFTAVFDFWSQCTVEKIQNVDS